MILYIKEIAWGIDRKNGGYKERVTAKEAFHCKVGPLPEFGRGGRNFVIDEASEKSILLSVHYERNPSADKSWTLEKDDEIGYTPRSFDGGYKYEFTLK